MRLLVFEDAGFRNLFPLVYSRATFNLRCGFDNLLAKIEAAQSTTAEAVFVRPALAAVMAERQTRRVNQPSTAPDQLWINGRALLRKRVNLPPLSAAWRGQTLLAARVSCALGAGIYKSLFDPPALRAALATCQPAEISEDALMLIDYPWQLVHQNAAEIVRQSAGREFGLPGNVRPGAHLVAGHPIHVGAGATIKPGAVLDADDGPIYIGDNALVQAGAVIIGPAFVDQGCVIQPGTRVRGGCSIGPCSRIGGELEATIVHGYSNKQHDGFIGHSYIGEWVNLGADTVGSDLKNTYGPVRVPVNGRPVDSGQMFVGAFIGDHTKTAIRTALPTGCVIGYACSIVKSGYVPQFVPSFTWLSDAGMQPHEPHKALAVARAVVARRDRKLSPAEEKLFLSIAETARQHEVGA